MPSATFDHATTVPVSASRMWDLLQDPDTWRSIGPLDEVTSSRIAEDGTLNGFRWQARVAGRILEGTATQTEVEVGAKIVLALDSSEMTGWIAAEVEAHEPTWSHLEVTLHARSDDLLASMFWGAVSDALERGLRTQVEALSERLAMSD